MPRLYVIAPMLVVALTLGACSRGTPSLMNIRNDESGPDEFSVVPTEPIEIPQDLSALPAPTPGGTNRTDPDPEGDAIRALGGDPERAARQSADVVNHASRFGVSENIRSVTAQEDAAYRSNNRGRLLPRLFGNNLYYDAYRPMALDQYRELERLRQNGVRTPAAPPPEIVNAE